MNIQAESNLDKILLRLSDLLEERNFNKIETNMLLIGTPQQHKKMIQILENNPKITEEEFLELAKKLEN